MQGARCRVSGVYGLTVRRCSQLQEGAFSEKSSGVNFAVPSSEYYTFDFDAAAAGGGLYTYCMLLSRYKLRPFVKGAVTFDCAVKIKCAVRLSMRLGLVRAAAGGGGGEEEECKEASRKEVQAVIFT